MSLEALRFLLFSFQVFGLSSLMISGGIQVISSHKQKAWGKARTKSSL